MHASIFSGKDINTLADPFCMLVGVIKRGKYGERLLETIKDHTGFEVVSVDVPEILPGFIEDPEELVRELNLDPQIFQADLLILYTFHPDLTPEIVRLAGKEGVKAVIIPGGIGRAGSITELEKIKDLQVLSGKFTMDPNTHNPLNKPCIIETIKDGAIQFVTKVENAE